MVRKVWVGISTISSQPIPGFENLLGPSSANASLRGGG